MNILHRDISLFNLLLVVAIHSNISKDFLVRALQEPEKAVVRAKIQRLSHRGLLGDWGYAVPTVNSCSKNLTQGDATSATGVRISGETEPLSRTNLKDTHNIVIPVADEPLLSDTGSSIDVSPLQRTVCFQLYIYTVFLTYLC